MSVRPQTKLILGVNDLHANGQGITDSRFTRKNEDIYVWHEGGPVPLPIISDEQKNPDHPDWLKNEIMATVKHVLTDHRGVPKKWNDVFHWNGEFGDPQVCGYVLEAGKYDDNLFRALILLHEEYGTTEGHRVLPSEGLSKFDCTPYGQALWQICKLLNDRPDYQRVSTTLREWVRSAEDDTGRAHRKEIISNAVTKNRLIRWGLNVRWWSNEMEIQIAVARWLFRQAGFRVLTRDLKLMFYWDWS